MFKWSIQRARELHLWCGVKGSFSFFSKKQDLRALWFLAEFFIGGWKIFGAEVIDAVQEFFTSGRLLTQWNATTLVLIPKSTNASRTKDFRPIFCLNILYKLIAKFLTKRLQKLLPQVISPFQSAFLPGRLLAKNILLAFEIINAYNRQNIDSRGMIKIDLRKAFDSIRWGFIISALKD